MKFCLRYFSCMQFTTECQKTALFAMLVKNGSRESEIVVLFLAIVECAAVLAKVVSLFKCHNSSWGKKKWK